MGLRPGDKYCSIKCKEKNRYHSEARTKWKKENKTKLYQASRKWALKNKDKVLQLNYDWKKRNPERAAQIAFKNKLKSEFNMSLDDYETLMKEQNYSCAICERHESEFNRRLHLDVDHKTRELRGALCYTCNRNLIGQHRDPNLFRKAADYLDKKFTGIFVSEKHVKKKRRAKKK